MAKKEKVQITMDEELLQDVDDYCDKHYMNRSWMISQACLQLVNQQKMIDAITNMSTAMKRISITGTIDDDAKKDLEAFEAISKMFMTK
jgi:metal-responsive CopG/Arc/MetJ family transcriptional regulator